MGGNVFGSDPIEKKNVQPTIKHFLSEFIRVFPKARGHFETMKTLGSTGKKEISGDIDLAVDGKALKDLKSWGIDEKDVQAYVEKFTKSARTASKQKIYRKAVVMALGDVLESSSSSIKIPDTSKRQSSAGNGVLFCCAQQFDPDGKPILGKGVQIDVNFGDLDWLEFAMYSGDTDMNIKGLHRTQLIVALLKVKGYTFDHHTGVKNKETGELVADTPAKALELLSSLYGCEFTKDTLSSYYKLFDFLNNNLNSDDLQQVLDEYITILDRTPHQRIPANMENYWLDNQERLHLHGKWFEPSDRLYPFRDE